MAQDSIIIVSGLPRSGTSMMMQMLEAGGVEILTDNIRTADDDNPKGYFEFEKVKELGNDKSWLDEAKGKAVKIICVLLEHIPPEYSCKVIFMHREMKEILASQKKMLNRRGQPTDTITDEKIAKIFFLNLEKVKKWLEQQPNIDVLYVHYSDVLNNFGKNIRKINEFLGYRLDEKNMAVVINKALHRQR